MAEEDKKEGLEPQDEPEKDSGDASAPVEPENTVKQVPEHDDNVRITGDKNIFGDGNISILDGKAILIVRGNGNRITIGDSNDEKLEQVTGDGTFSRKIREIATQQHVVDDEGGEDIDEIKSLSESKQTDFSSKTPSRKKKKAVASPQDWFNKLSENQKLYALFVNLLPNITRETLDDVYILAVNNLRETGLSDWIEDARILGLDDLLDALDATEENGIVRLFPEYAMELQKQTNNRHHLLWTIFESLLLNDDGSIASTDWGFRKALGHAVALIGIRYPSKLKHLLDTIATHQSHKMVVIAGYALAEIAKQERNTAQIALDILDSWIKTKHPDFSWAATAAIWRIYKEQGVKAEIFPLLWEKLEVLIEDIDDLDARSKFDILFLIGNGKQDEVEKQLAGWFWEKVNVISYALRQMFDVRPGEVVSHLNLWFNTSEEDNRLFIAQRASKSILNRLFRQDELDFEDASAVLALYSNILKISAIDDDLFRIAFIGLKSWLTSDKLSDADQKKLQNRLNGFIYKWDSEKLRAFREGIIRYWFLPYEESESRVNDIARELLSTTYFIDGYPILSETLGELSLFVDAKERENNYLRVAECLHEILNSVVNTSVSLLGYSKLVGTTEKPYIENNQLIFHSLPRLIVPPLKSSFEESKKTSLLNVIITQGEVLDLSEIPVKFPDVEVLQLLFSSSPAEKVVEEDEGWLSNQNYFLDELETNFEERPLWQLLSDNIFSFWVNKFTRRELHSPKGQISLKNIKTEIESIFKKDHIGRSDYITLSQLYLFLYQNDIEYATDACCEWLSLETDDNILTMAGVSFGKFLLRAFLHRDSFGKNSQNLFSLLIKANPDWSVFKLILENIRKQYNLQHQNDIGDIDIRQLVSSLPASLRENVFKLVENWISDKKTPERSRKFAENFKQFLEIGALFEIPELAEKQKFGLIFIDSTLNNATEYLYAFVKSLSELSPEEKEKILLVIHILGQNMPVSLGYSTKHLMPQEALKTPNLISPILTNYPPDLVFFRVVMTRNSVVDFYDRQKKWEKVPTVILNANGYSRTLESPNLLSMPFYKGGSNKVADTIGSELQKMIGTSKL